MEGEVAFTQPIVVIVDVVATFVTDEGLADNGNGAVGVTFPDIKSGEVVHSFPAHGHGLYGHNQKGLVEGGLGCSEVVLGHIYPRFVDQGQTGGVGGVSVADGEVAVAEGVIVFLISEVSIADVGVGEALTLEDKLIGGRVGLEPGVAKGYSCKEFLDDGLLVGMGADEVGSPLGKGCGLVVQAVELF